MSSINFRENSFTEVNSVGTPVRAISAQAQLTRATLAHMLWEDSFYVDGKTNADQVKELVAKVKPEFVSELAVKARTAFKLRHIPLLLTRELARTGNLKADTLNAVIQRPDEMSEFLSIYWKDGKTPIAAQVKRGLAKAFGKFNEYQLAKWDKNSAAISLRDVMFLTHPNPSSTEQAVLFNKVANGNLTTPDTWETELSAGKNKAEVFSRLMVENKLGALAFLRNLRNMVQSGISETAIRSYAKTLNVDKVLPYRFIAAARIVPQFEDMLEEMMFRAVVNHEKLPGRTVLVVDTSGSMGQHIGGKSDMNRLDAACALAILAREICEEVVIYATAGNDGTRTHATAKLPPRRGFALAEYIHKGEVVRKLGGGGIFFLQCMDHIARAEYGNQVDRVIVYTDEQDTGGRGFEPGKAKRLTKDKNYILNVGSYKNGINSGAWETVTGFSEATINYIQARENELVQ
jgi:60 kDa SS-A/Ro ribonucleoprotein